MSPAGASRGRAIALALVVAATALMARHALPVGFVGQDTYPLLLTARVTSADDLVHDLSHELMDGRYAASFYRPVFGLSLALDHALWGLDPRGYQGTSLLFYGVGGFVVFLLGRRLLGEEAVVGPLAAAALFLLHPAQVEVVPVPARRPDLLCWVFLGLALALPAGKHGRASVPAAISGFLAMMSKEAGLLLPGLAFLAACVASEREGLVARSREALRSVVPHAIALAVALAIRFAVLGGIGGHGANVREATLDRVPNTLLATWALLVQPQPVTGPGIAGGAFVTAWSVIFLGVAAYVASRPAGRALVRAMLPPFLWLVALATTYALTGGIQAWYLVLPLAAFALVLGGAAEGARRASGRTGVLLGVLIAIVVAGHLRYSPLFVRYPAWDKATAAGNAFLEELASRVDAAAPGSRLEAPPIPSWVPATPGAPGVRGASVLAPYSVQAWLELRRPQLRVRVSRDPSAVPAPDEIVVVVDRVRPGFEVGGRGEDFGLQE